MRIGMRATWSEKLTDPCCIESVPESAANDEVKTRDPASTVVVPV